MPLTEQELKQLLDENHQALAVYTTGHVTTETVILLIDEKHRHAGDHIATTFHGVPITVRYAQGFVIQPPRDPEATVGLPELDVPPDDAN